jgi:hypothetical protein
MILSLRNGQQEAFGPKDEVMKKLKAQAMEARKAQAARAGVTTKSAKRQTSKPASKRGFSVTPEGDTTAQTEDKAT